MIEGTSESIQERRMCFCKDGIEIRRLNDSEASQADIVRDIFGCLLLNWSSSRKELRLLFSTFHVRRIEECDFFGIFRFTRYTK